MTEGTLTKKQQKVFDLLQQGLKPQAIATRMKISTNGVYGHMKRIREAGFEIPNGDNAAANGAARAEALVQIDALVKDAIGTAEERMRAIDARRSELSEERDKLDSEDTALAKEEELLGVERDRLTEVVG